MAEKKTQKLPIGTEYNRLFKDQNGDLQEERVIVSRVTPHDKAFVGRRMFKYIRALQYWENTFVKPLEQVAGDEVRSVP